MMEAQTIFGNFRLSGNTTWLIREFLSPSVLVLTINARHLNTLKYLITRKAKKLGSYK